jgi:ketosteroid isomerase-like protein
MSKENVAIVQAAWDAFSPGEVTAWLEYCTGNIDYRAAEGAIDDRGPLHGKEALRAYVEDWLDTFDNVRVEPVELIDAGGENVIAVLRNTARAKLSGIETELTYAALYTLRDGKIARAPEYWTREEALEAAGLSDG